MVTGLNHLTLSVKSLDVSFRFYRDTLGFKPVMKSRRMGYLLAGGLWLCLDEDPAVRPGALTEYTHIAFSVSAEDFEPARARLRAAGAVFWKENVSEGPSLYFLDPNGHKLELHVGTWQSRVADAKADPWEPGMEFFV